MPVHRKPHVKEAGCRQPDVPVAGGNIQDEADHGDDDHQGRDRNQCMHVVAKQCIVDQQP